MRQFSQGLVLVLAVTTAMSHQAAAQGTGDSTDASVIAMINQQIEQSWADNEFKPSPPAPEGKWVRRVFLDVLGRIPTHVETTKFLANKDEDKREQLINELLSEEYELEFARNWTTVWTNILIGRSGGNDPERPVNRKGLQKYLRDSFLRHKPYDKMAFELISATGMNKPGEAGFNGAVNFLLDNLQDDQVPATNKVSRIFLGLRVGCTQCHNHPFNEWKQDQFWSFNAFFKQAKPLRTFGEGQDILMAELQDEDFGGQDGNFEQAALFYQQRNGLTKVAYPRFVDGTKIDPVGIVSETNRRMELAKLVQNSPNAAQAMVNRVWGQYM
ncbi:MAG: DUF1549 domain-containing protein, partial [Planctomycetales bacterium]